MGLFSRAAGQGASWTVVSTDTGHLRYVQGRAAAEKPRVFAFGEAAVEGQGLARAARDLKIPRRGQLAVLLNAPDYRIHMVDAPNVPEAEFRTAIKWRLKEIIDFPVEEACYDVLDLPAEKRGSAQAHSVYAIAAKRDVLKSYVERFDQARLPVSVIDIPETAQRNVNALYEEENRGAALLYFDESGGLLTVTHGGELCLARRLDITLAQLRATEGEGRSDLFNRILLELQRTLDNFERQFNFITVGKLMLGPEPENLGLLDYLHANLGIRVEAVDLASVIELPGHELDAQSQWRFFHLIGCSFRAETAPH
jgi:MSHA biogenesis protein MshI